MDDGKLYQDYDGYTVYYRGDSSGNPTQDTAKRIIEHASYMNSKVGSDQTSNSQISPTSAIFDIAKPNDVAVDLTLNGNTLLKIENNSVELKEGQDYALNGSQVVINKSYLKKLSTGTSSLTFEFNQGKSPQLSIKIIDGSGSETTEGFVYSDKTAFYYEAYWRSVYDTIYEESAAGALFLEFNNRQLRNFSVQAGDKILGYFKEISDKMKAKNIKENNILHIF